ncbi:hypothetical protein [Streptomyces sp. CC77]|uniref:hypothetical protein n=1 Tax=Streptomyces sp. CC77 TaxID=1906739 RepID=UPI0008DE3F43|nr:hypothetical protein [Streptomyces sp. CC77]OII68077.1 hypothetical protein BJP39_05780 [Streptomyces sp. CC77]
MTQSGHGQEGQTWGQPPGQPWGPPPPQQPGPYGTPQPQEQPPHQQQYQPPQAQPQQHAEQHQPPYQAHQPQQHQGQPPHHQPPHPPQQPPGQPPQQSPQQHQAPQQHQDRPPQHQPQPYQPQQHQAPPQQPEDGGDPATQYLRAVPPAPPESPAESTQVLGTGYAARHRSPQPGRSHQPPQAGRPPQPPPGGPDAEATQYIPPVTGHTGPPGPPAEFDNLFRDDAPGATQQIPRFDSGLPPAAPQQGYGQQPYGRRQHAPYGEHADAYDEGPEPRRRSSKLALGAAVVVGCAVIGLGAGALMSGGDTDDRTGNAGAAVSAAASAPETAPSAGPSPSEKPVDPAEKQAGELDKLLADSGASRASVISSVEKIKQCKDLDRAAADLKAAAAQRRELVTRLKAIEIDKLPDHAALGTSLTEAWQASATADDHYAAWAVQVKKPKYCKDGEAQRTKHTAQASRSSGEATAAKQKAARLWNGIAETYGLTKRQPTQL